MNENCVELASLVRFTIVDTLKKSAPGISETMRDAIANSVMTKLRAQAPSAFPNDVSKPFFLTAWEREDYERRQRCEPELGPKIP